MRTRERLVSRFRRGYSSRCRWALEVQPAFAKFKESTRNVEQSRANAATACMHAGSVGFGRSMARITLKSQGRWGGTVTSSPSGTHKATLDAEVHRSDVGLSSPGRTDKNFMCRAKAFGGLRGPRACPRPVYAERAASASGKNWVNG
jgi:hypothetical protein